MYISINKQNAVKALEKKISEIKIAERVTERGIKAIESVKHHKNVTKKVVSAVKDLGGYATLYADGYASRIVIYFDHEDRFYPSEREGIADYYAETQVDIYYTGGYAEMLESAQKRLTGLQDERTRLQSELDDLDIIVAEAEALSLAYDKIESRSYIIREVFGIR